MDQEQAKNVDLPGLNEADQQKVAEAADQSFQYAYPGASLQRINYTLSVSSTFDFFSHFRFRFGLNLIWVNLRLIRFGRASIRTADMSTSNKEMAWIRKWYALFVVESFCCYR